MSRDASPLAAFLALLPVAGCPAPEGGPTTIAVTTAEATTGVDPGTPTRAPDTHCPTGGTPPKLVPGARWVEVEVQNGVGCARDRDGYLTCFGEASEELNARIPREPVLDFAVGGGFLGISLACAISAVTGEIGCWSGSDERLAPPVPQGNDWRMIDGDGTMWGAVDGSGRILCWNGLRDEGEPYDVCRISEGLEVAKLDFGAYWYPTVLLADGNLTYLGGLVLAEDVQDFAGSSKGMCYTRRTDLRPFCREPVEWVPSDCPWIGLDMRLIYSVGIRVDGSLEAGALPWDDMLDYPDLLPEGTFVSVSGDPRAGCALSAEGTIACWDYAGVLTRNVPK